MARMEGVQFIGGVWKVRRRIPAECRAAFGVQQFFTRSLKTKNEREAVRLAAPILAEIDAKIAAARAGLTPEPVKVIERWPVLAPQAATRAIEDWRRDTCAGAYVRAYSNLLPPLTNDEAVAASSLRALLRGGRDEPEGFDARMAEALSRSGVSIPEDHPMLRRPELRRQFRAAWSSVEDHIDDFRHDRFEGWPDYSDPVPVPMANEPTRTLTAAKAGVKLLDLFSTWTSIKAQPPRVTGYVQRLSEFLGNPDIATITPLDMDRFKLALERFPNTKRDISKVEFLAAIERAEKADPDYRRLHVKTIWNWTVAFKQMFEFAVERDLIAKNPAANMMAKPSAEESKIKRPYEADDIATIFNTGMFRGSSGTGYRNKPGRVITRDHKFWLPIVALWTGMRVDEIATLSRAEIKELDGIHYIDLTARAITRNAWRRVKNASARRIIPIPDKLIAVGFLRYVEGQKEWVFPELYRPKTDTKKWSAKFTGWWGLWAKANAPKKGEGMDEPEKTFHSFRHSWKAVAQLSAIKEEIHDEISGHKGGGVGRHYGKGAVLTYDRLKILKGEIDQIDFPTFAL